MKTKPRPGNNHHRPLNTFADLMEMYEANYIRLRLICGEIRGFNAVKISQVEGGVPIQLRILEQCRHTTTFQLDYLFGEDEARRPNLVVRVYHDARQAEVISKQCKLTGMRKTVNDKDQQPEQILLCRWRLNRFLYKWLGYMRYQGHAFTD